MLEFSELVAFVGSTDLGRARRFYEETLGLRVAREGRYRCDLTAGGTTVRLELVEGYAPHSSTVLGWSVQDIGTILRNLSARGVAFERYSQLDQDELGIWTAIDGSQAAWFKDPDGNVLSLVKG
jgi:hypothetical protein